MPNTKEDRRNAYKAMIADMRSRRDSNSTKMEHAQQMKKAPKDSAVMNDADRLKYAARLNKKVPAEDQRKAEVRSEYEQQRKKSQAGKFWDGMND